MNILFIFRIFEQLALALRNRVALKFFIVLKYYLSFRIFEQLALALKNKVRHCIEYIFTFRIFEQLALARKTEFALIFLTVFNIAYFLHSGFFSNLHLP